jgi:hypothetical protein
MTDDFGTVPPFRVGEHLDLPTEDIFQAAFADANLSGYLFGTQVR